MHFSHCRVLGWWAETIFSRVLYSSWGLFHLPSPTAAVSVVSWMVKPQFGPTNVIRSLGYFLNLVPAALKPLLVLGSSAFPFPLCLALKSMMLHCKVDLDILFLNFRTAAKVPAPVFWGWSKYLNQYLLLAQTTRKIFSACLYLLSQMQGESTAVLHYIASNTSFAVSSSIFS